MCAWLAVVLLARRMGVSATRRLHAGRASTPAGFSLYLVTQHHNATDFSYLPALSARAQILLCLSQQLQLALCISRGYDARSAAISSLPLVIVSSGISISTGFMANLT